MRFGSIFILLCGMCAAQGMPFPGPGTAHSSGGGGSAARVQVATGNGGTSTNPFTVTTSATGTGHLLVVMIFKFYTAAGSTLPTVSDGVNSWTQALDLENVSGTGGCCGRMTVYYTCNSISGATTTTVTITDKRASAVEAEYSGVQTSTCLDVVSSALNPQNGVTSWSSTAVTTTVKDVLIGMVSNVQSNARTFAATGSWTTLIDAPNTLDGDDAFTEEQLNVAAGSQTTAGSVVSSNVMNGIVTFKVQ